MKAVIILQLWLLHEYYLDEIANFRRYGDDDAMKAFRGRARKLKKLIKQYESETL